MKQLYPNDVDDANAGSEKLPEAPGDSAEWEDGETAEEMLKPRRLASPAEPSKEEREEHRLSGCAVLSVMVQTLCTRSLPRVATYRWSIS